MEKYIRQVFAEQRMINEMDNAEYAEYLKGLFNLSHGPGKRKKNKKKSGRHKKASRNNTLK